MQTFDATHFPIEHPFYALRNLGVTSDGGLVLFVLFTVMPTISFLCLCLSLRVLGGIAVGCWLGSVLKRLGQFTDRGHDAALVGLGAGSSWLLALVGLASGSSQLNSTGMS
jgi:hypothetical protein